MTNVIHARENGSTDRTVSCNLTPHSGRLGFAGQSGVVYSQIGDNSNGKQTKLVIVAPVL